MGHSARNTVRVRFVCCVCFLKNGGGKGMLDLLVIQHMYGTWPIYGCFIADHRLEHGTFMVDIDL